MEQEDAQRGGEWGDRALFLHLLHSEFEMLS